MKKENDSIIFRQLSKSDFLTLRDLNLVFGEAFEDHETHLSKIPSDEYLQNLLSKDHFVALVAFSENRVVGGLIAYILDKYEQERSEAYIYDLAVDQNFRRQGIARGLLEALKPIAKSKGAWVIYVQADRVDIPAVALYESMGEKEEPLHFDIPIE